MSLRARLYRFRSFWIFPAIAIVMIDLTARLEPDASRSDLLWQIPAGILIWTLLEYMLHRFVFHVRIPVRNPRLRAFAEDLHLAHHAAPRDPKKVLVQPVLGLIISSALFAVIYAITWSLFSTAGLMTGIWAGFLYYESVHYRVHFSLARSGVIGWQRRAHFYHHFTDNRLCFGVTSPVWDYVFGTALPRPTAL
jgi:4-hydroxysphinganine ceramide fatty acyl 2-hydroxylase